MACRMCTYGLLAAVAGAAFIGGRMSTTVEGNAAMADQPETLGPPLSAEHKRLETMLGEWEGTVRVKMGGEWSEWDTEIERERAMDGLFVIEEVESTSEMGTYKGMGIMGYDPAQKKYTGVWIENTSPSITTSTGTYDEAGKTWTFHGEMVDPATGQKVKTISTVNTADPDKEVMEGFVVMPDGSKDKNFEATFSRDD